MDAPARDRLLAWLEAQPHAILTIVGARTDHELAAQPQPGRWSARLHLAHIGRMHEVYLARVQRILTEDAPALAAYRAEQDAEWARWEGMALAEILQRVRDRRAELSALLRNLSSEQWQRVGRHSTFGPLTLVAWINFFLVHEGHHLYTALTLAGVGRR